METEQEHSEPWLELKALTLQGDANKVETFLHDLGSNEASRALSRLDEDDRGAVLTLLSPEQTAELLKNMDDAVAVELIEDLPAEQAAHIVDAMPSDDRADVLSGLSEDDAASILEVMGKAEASDARLLMQYDADTAGGLMIREYLAYREDLTIGDVLDDFRKAGETYSDYAIQYAYVVDKAGVLKGVLKMRDLLLSNTSQPLRDVMLADPLHVQVSAPLDELTAFFGDYQLLGAPVVDTGGKIIGVIRRAAVNDAMKDHATRTFLKLSGLRGQEELRSMPVLERATGRLIWLVPNIALNVIAASVIAMFQDTLQAVIALAVFLPIISDMSGCSGNQAVAVSLRELALGLVKPYELFRVLLKEMYVGMINGAVLGTILGGLAWLWKGNIYLGLVVGFALTLNTFLSVMLGGSIPLILRRLRKDPALASGPILTTVTDLVGFFIVLALATVMLSKITM